MDLVPRKSGGAFDAAAAGGENTFVCGAEENAVELDAAPKAEVG